MGGNNSRADMQAYSYWRREGQAGQLPSPVHESYMLDRQLRDITHSVPINIAERSGRLGS